MYSIIKQTYQQQHLQLILLTARVYVDGQAEFDKFHQAKYNADPTASATANTFSVVTTAGATANDPDTYEILQRWRVAYPPQ